MNKRELAKKTAANLGVSVNAAMEMINTIVDTIGQSLKDGDNVVISGFGSFSVTERKSRIGRNPKTGEVVPIGSRLKPVFKASEQLKGSINNFPKGD